MGGACSQQHGDGISQIHYKNGESLLVRPVTPAPSIRGRGGVVVGVIHPWGIGIPCRFVSRSRPTTILKHGGLSQSVTITTVVGHGNPLPRPILSNFFNGGFFGIYIYKILFYFFLSRADDFDFPCGAFGSRSTNEEVEHTHSAGGAWQPSNEIMDLPRPFATVATIGRQKLRDGFGSSQVSFWYQLMFSSGNNPAMTLLIDGALVGLNSNPEKSQYVLIRIAV